MVVVAEFLRRKVKIAMMDHVNLEVENLPAKPAFGTPIVMIVFRRPEVTKRVFAAVAAARPERLFLIADGPSADRPADAQACEEVRKIVTQVDWPCKVQTNFSEQNMGLRQRIVSGLNWVFSEVEEAIILEDDCLPDPSFFPFCAEMLERYRDHNQIGFIAGFNPMESMFKSPFSYYFTQMPHIWGWATWRRAWRQYDDCLESWPAVKEAGLLNMLFPDKAVAAYWTRIFDGTYNGTRNNSWAYRWVYTCWMRNWLQVVPSRNLIQNVGFGPDSEHTAKAPRGHNVASASLTFPLHHPPAITAWPAQFRATQRQLYVPSIPYRITARILRLLRISNT